MYQTIATFLVKTDYELIHLNWELFISYKGDLEVFYVDIVLLIRLSIDQVHQLK